MSGVVASLYANFYANTANLKKGLGDARGMLDQFKGSLAGAGVTGGQVFAALTLAGAATFKVIKQSLKSTAELTDQVRALSRATGMTYEESSKLIQVADNAQVSFGSFETAMRQALKNGFNPTIDAIAELSDQYLAIQDPIARAQLLTEIFGRTGLELNKILELGSATIQQMGDDTAQFGLVFDEADIKKMHDYEMAINDIQTAWKGLQGEIALAVAPAITSAANGLTDFIAKERDFSQVVDVSSQLLKDKLISVQDVLYITRSYEGAEERLIKTLERKGIAISQIKDKSVFIDIYIRYHGAGFYGGIGYGSLTGANALTSPGGGGNNIYGLGVPEASGAHNFLVPGYAQGGQFIVPRGFSGMSSGYPIMVHSGERVNVDTASKTQVDNGALLSELQGMRSELATLKTSIRDAVLMAV